VNFQQLRSVRETVRQGFNLTGVAAVLHTSQPGVSRQIRELEDELGIELFHRAGKRLTGLTPPGQAVLPIVERLLLEADNLKRAGEDFASTDRGTLTIAATHSQARYALPPAVRDFSAAHPEVVLRLHQGSPKQVAEMLLSGEADIGVATEALAQYAELVALPSYRWTHAVVVPRGHELAALAAQGEALTLEQLARYPIITYEPGYTGRTHIDEAFQRRRLAVRGDQAHAQVVAETGFHIRQRAVTRAQPEHQAAATFMHPDQPGQVLRLGLQAGRRHAQAQQRPGQRRPQQAQHHRRGNHRRPLPPGAPQTRGVS